MYMPNSVGKDTVMFPGFDGGAEWGGSAFDPATHILYLNANDVGLTESLLEHKSTSAGESIYQTQCALCHGANLKGQPPAFPSLENLQEKDSVEQVMDLIRNGKGRMLALPGVSDADRRALAVFVLNGGAGEKEKTQASAKVTYDTTGYHKFFDQDGYPAVKPPWGTLNAINLDTGDYVWKIPLVSIPNWLHKGWARPGQKIMAAPSATARRRRVYCGHGDRQEDSRL